MAEVVELIAGKCAWVSQNGSGRGAAVQTRHVAQMATLSLADTLDLILCVAKGKVAETLGFHGTGSPELGIDVGTHGNVGLSEKRTDGDPVDFVLVGKLDSREIEPSGHEVGVLQKLLAANSFLHPGGPAHDARHLGSAILVEGSLVAGTMIGGEENQGIFGNSQFVQLGQKHTKGIIHPQITGLVLGQARLANPFHLVFFHAESLDHPDSRNRFDQQGAQSAEADLAVADRFFVAESKDVYEKKGDGDDDQGH